MPLSLAEARKADKLPEFIVEWGAEQVTPSGAAAFNRALA